MKISEEPAFHSIKIEGDPNSIYKRVLLDGKELKGLRALTMCYRVDEVPTAFIEMEVMTTDLELTEPKAVVLLCDKEWRNIEDAHTS